MDRENKINRYKVFGKKSAFYVTAIQNAGLTDHFRYCGEWCRLNVMNPNYFFFRDKDGSRLELIVDHIDRIVAIYIDKNNKGFNHSKS